VKSARCNTSNVRKPGAARSTFCRSGPITSKTNAGQVIRKATGLTALIATHNLDLAARINRRVTIREGRVTEMG
jgi:hypothetical protein